jgi:hypothetical protein
VSIDKIKKNGKLIYSGSYITERSSMNNPPFPYYPNVTNDEVGPERIGQVTAYTGPMFDIFFVTEDGQTGIVVGVTKKFTDPLVWDTLCIGTRVKFRCTNHLVRVVEISVIP